MDVILNVRCNPFRHCLQRKKMKRLHLLTGSFILEISLLSSCVWSRSSLSQNFLELVSLIFCEQLIIFILATEELSLRTGETVGGLLNATFGNAVELIISVVALKDGLLRIVQVRKSLM